MSGASHTNPGRVKLHSSDCSPSSDLTGFCKSPKWSKGLHLWSKGQVNFDTVLTNFNSRQFIHEWRKWPLNLISACFLMFFCLACIFEFVDAVLLHASSPNCLFSAQTDGQLTSCAIPSPASENLLCRRLPLHQRIVIICSNNHNHVQRNSFSKKRKQQRSFFLIVRQLPAWRHLQRMFDANL